MQRQIRRPRETILEEYEYDRHWESARDQTILTRDHIGRNIHELHPGDHIGWERLYIIVHHAIVFEVKLNSVVVFHFSKDETDGRVKIFKEEIENNDSKNRFLFRFNYPLYLLIRNPPSIVFQRAETLCEQKESYSLFSNNCEHFATYCKTGKKTSCQTEWLCNKVEDAAALSSALGLMETLKPLARTNLERSACQSTSRVLQETGAHSARRVVFGPSSSAKQSGIPTQSSIKVSCKAATKYASSSKSAMREYATRDIGQIWGGSTTAAKICTRIGTVAGAAISAVIDIVSTGKDIYKYKKLKDAGKMSKEDFKKNVTERVCEGAIGSIATIVGNLGGMKVGALAGAAIGVGFGPVGAVVGAGIGSVVGAMVGSFIASGIGKAIGRTIGRFFGRLFL